MRNLGGAPHKNLAGSFLVAHPGMLDPNFRRSVLFISSHDAQDGAVGLIINRPLDKNVSDVVNELPPHGLGDVPVFVGGPVGKNQLVFAAFEWKQGQGLKVDHAVDMEEASQRAEIDPASVRAFVGYAGWSAGQLEAEMKQQAWIVHKPNRSAIKPESLPKLWFNIMRSLGPWYKMMAASPDDPSLN